METAIIDYTPPHAVITTEGLLMAMPLAGRKPIASTTLEGGN
ncbi:MAG: hypothetical protein V7K18_26005 [Nostoc sp.]